MNSEEIRKAMSEIAFGITFEKSSFAHDPEKYRSVWDELEKDIESIKSKGGVMDIPSELD